jgi:malonyl-CoA O-methyltransferase
MSIPSPEEFPQSSKIVESFSKHAKTYDRRAFLQKNMAERLAALIPEEKFDSILEIGCGTGLFTRHLLTLSPKKLILNDISSAMIDCLVTQFELPSSAKIFIGDAEKLDFPKPNLVAANAVFQWLNSPESTLKKMFDLQPKDGCIIFSVFGPKTLFELREMASINSASKLISLSGWKTILMNAGYKITKAEKEMRKVFFPSAGELIKNLQQTGASPFSKLKAGTLRKLLRDYDSTFSTSQGIYSTWELYFLSAKKNKD